MLDHQGGADFWQNKRVLITGHTGFKGMWLSFWLHQMGAEVFGYAKAPVGGKASLYHLLGADQWLAASTFADVDDLATLQKAVLDAKADVIFHLAAQPLVRYGYHHPVETYRTNVMGTVHVLEAFRHSPSSRVLVNVTTDKCYHNNGWDWGYRENDALGGNDPYSNSKSCSEWVSQTYKAAFLQDKVIATARAGNVIGGGDWAEDRLLPDVVRALQQGKPIVLRHLQAVRPWQHVLEPLSGYLALAEHLWQAPSVYQGAWNFGPQLADCLPVGDVVASFLSLWGKPDWPIETEATNAAHTECSVLRLDADKARCQLHWQPRWSLKQALLATADWYKAYGEGLDVSKTMLDQITTFCNKEAMHA